MDRETLIDVARTSLSTKVDKEIAEILTEVCMMKHDVSMCNLNLLRQNLLKYCSMWHRL